MNSPSMALRFARALLDDNPQRSFDIEVSLEEAEALEEAFRLLGAGVQVGRDRRRLTILRA